MSVRQGPDVLVQQEGILSPLTREGGLLRVRYISQRVFVREGKSGGLIREGIKRKRRKIKCRALGEDTL